MRRPACRSLLVISSLVIFSSTTNAADSATDKVASTAGPAAKQRLFRHLADDVLLPLTDDFASAAGKLATTSNTYCNGKASLKQLQAAWRATQSAWQPLEMLQLGPVIERRTQRQINAWPVRPTLLEPLLAARKPISPATMETQGAAGKGLPAIEYLLFADPTTSGPAPKKPLAAAHCNALQALAYDVKAEADALAADWREPNGGFARQLKEAGKHPQDGVFASEEQALSDVLNLLIAGLDAIKIRKVGKPLEKSADTAALERIESWRAGTSLDHIHDNLRGFERLFFGAGNDGFGLDDYLLGLERPILVRNVRERLDAAMRALAAIHPPLQQAVIAQRTQVEHLRTELHRLQHVLETQAADALKVDPGFNANDGD